MFACLFIITNVISTKAKVKEILKTGRSAHNIRQSMFEITKNLPSGSKIAVLRAPRLKSSLGRFGERGVRANGGFSNPRTTKHYWRGFPLDMHIKKLQNFDMVLKECENQSKLCIVYFKNPDS